MNDTNWIGDGHLQRLQEDKGKAAFKLSRAQDEALKADVAKRQADKAVEDAQADFNRLQKQYQDDTATYHAQRTARKAADTATPEPAPAPAPAAAVDQPAANATLTIVEGGAKPLAVLSAAELEMAERQQRGWADRGGVFLPPRGSAEELAMASAKNGHTFRTYIRDDGGVWETTLGQKEPLADMKAAVGDVVRLKTGGPDMTVDEVGADGALTCSWLFLGSKTSSRFQASDVFLLQRPMEDQD